MARRRKEIKENTWRTKNKGKNSFDRRRSSASFSARLSRHLVYQRERNIDIPTFQLLLNLLLEIQKLSMKSTPGIESISVLLKQEDMHCDIPGLSPIEGCHIKQPFT